MKLPSDLYAAEAQLLTAVLAAFNKKPKGRWSAEIRFEGLRIMPVALRLWQQLANSSIGANLLFPDAGACALAKRDAPDAAAFCSTLLDWQRGQLNGNPTNKTEQQESPLILVAPGPPDYASVEEICTNHSGAVLLLNGRLEDAAIGIGSVARLRRKGFLATWQNAYCVQPLLEAALLHAFPHEWQLFKQSEAGFLALASFEQKPAAEELDAALGQGFLAIDRFLKDLS